MNFTGFFGAPYRPICGGWPGAPVYYLNPTNYLAADAAVAEYVNSTQVPNYDGSGGAPATIPPYQRPDRLNIGGCENSLLIPTPMNGIPCGPWPEPVPANTYALKSPAATVNLSACLKIGFKNVFARKAWHGMFGFDATDLCCTGTKPAVNATPTLTKYLKREWTFHMVEIVPAGDTAGDPEGTNTITGSGSSTVGRYTGNVDQQWRYDLTFGDGTTPSPPFPYNYSLGLITLGYCNGVWTGDTDSNGGFGILADLNSGSLVGATNISGWDITINTLDETHISITCSLVGGFGFSENVTATITLSQPYTSDDVNADVNGLLNWWNLADDRTYPWRRDSRCTDGPYVSYLENDPAQPGVAFLGSTGNGINGTATIGAATGEILGKPTVAGYDPFFDFRHIQFQLIGGVWEAAYYGQAAPSWARHATQWTNELDASALPPCEFRSCNTFVITILPGTPAYANGCLIGSKWAETKIPWFSHNFGRPWGAKDVITRDQSTVDCTPSGGGYVNEHGNIRWSGAFPIDGRRAVTAASNTNPIQITVDHDCALRTGDHVDISGVTGNTAANVTNQAVTVIDATHFTLNGVAGNGAYAGGGVVISHGAPAYQWDDNQSKGSYCIMTWTFDYRDDASGRPVTGSLKTVTMDHYCLAYTPCCPGVVYLTPNGETSANSATYAPPNLDCDECYGSQWQRAVKQWMQDPLWVAPHRPCDLDSAIEWKEDDGSGQCVGTDPTNGHDIVYYAQRPWEECEKSLPAGAPALPAGCYLGTLSVADYNSGTAGIFLSPPTEAACYMVPWVWALNIASDLAGTGGGCFTCDYDDPMAVCEDDTELFPP